MSTGQFINMNIKGQPMTEMSNIRIKKTNINRYCIPLFEKFKIDTNLKIVMRSLYNHSIFMLSSIPLTGSYFNDY